MAPFFLSYKWAAVVPAAGYGSFQADRPKVLESISPTESRPMLIEVVNTIKAVGIEKVVVVANQVYRSQIRGSLQRHFADDVAVAEQPWRLGAADAVSRALPMLEEWEISHFLVVYADNPLFTAETISELIELHRREGPVISMVSVRLNADHPRVLERYGRILRRDGRIIGVVEPGDATEEQLQANTVNPSLFIFNRLWFRDSIHLAITHCNRADGFPPEFYLPPLVAFATRHGHNVAELTLRDKEEALGVNTPEELEEVRRVFAARQALAKA